MDPDPNTTPTTRTTCRICLAPLEPILTLGPQYLPDFPRTAGGPLHPPVPLDLTRCSSDSCGLVQLRHTTPRDWLYREYWYRSGVNETMVEELRSVVEGALRWTEVSTKGLTVADIGANDGTLLRLWPEVLGRPGQPVRGLTRIAWEPAKNLYQALRPHAEVLIPDYFQVGGTDGWERNVHAISSVAMFYDLDDPDSFVAGIARILHPQGVWVVQQAYLPSMLAQTGYDNIGHEHLEYYHLAPLEALLARHGLEVFHVEHRAINGGSFRAYCGWAGAHLVQQPVYHMRAEEAASGLLSHPEALWAAFSLGVRTRVEQLSALLGSYEAAGAAVDLYGASTKGSTLLQTCGIDARQIRQAWERSPEKLGRYYGATGIPIVGEEEGRADPPSALLVTPWAFREAFLAREVEYLRAGGRIVFPLPNVEVILA